VVVHVSAENLTRNLHDVPAGTSQSTEAVCHLDGVGSVEAAAGHATRVPLATLQRSFLPKLRDHAAAIDAELRTVRWSHQSSSATGRHPEVT
jgi:hypothetical protein